MVYEAKARLSDPVYGCVAIIASLQTQVSQLQADLNIALAEAMTLRAQLSGALSSLISFQGSPTDYTGMISHEYDHQQLSEFNKLVPTHRIPTSEAMLIFPQLKEPVPTNEVPQIPEFW
ncbi:unnamed protein product [Ilex paraguariensis]|uniref:LOB domain-containing protein n=1 Tax=Ilex paraguariensis TaxID=185542 RepID=A0ABC8RFK4_9AQUA